MARGWGTAQSLGPDLVQMCEARPPTLDLSDSSGLPVLWLLIQFFST